MKFSIYRYNPETDAKPYMQDYDIVLEPTDKMLLDALVRIKSIDDTLSLRRSCREGVCGVGRDEHQWAQRFGLCDFVVGFEGTGGVAAIARAAGDPRFNRGYDAVFQAI